MLTRGWLYRETSLLQSAFGQAERSAAGPKPRRSRLSLNSALLRSGRTNEGSISSSSRSWHAALWEDRTGRSQHPALDDAAGVSAHEEISLRKPAAASIRASPFRAAR